MGFYREQVLPRVIERACAMPGMEKWRAQAVEGLRGRVVEIGFGSGLNVEHYPNGVDVVFAVEPEPVARRLARRRIASGPIEVQHVGVDGQSLPIPDNNCDAALSTFTLCTVPDVGLVLDEILRVLRPGGKLHFLEHGISPEPRVARWQRRLDPLQHRVGGGCHLTRDAGALVAGAGFRLEQCVQGYAKGPKPWSYFTVGVAAKPD